MTMSILIFQMERWSGEYDVWLKSVNQSIALKDARIRELEMELKKQCLEEGRGTEMDLDLHSLSNTAYRMCAPALITKEI